MILRITPLHPLFAAEIGGLDLALPLAEASLRALREALQAYRLLVFRDQHLAPSDQVAFTRRFGAPVLHAMPCTQLPGQPEIVLETDAADSRRPFGLGDLRWHADLAYTAQPNRVSALHAQSLPPAGGATLFADQYAAHDRLDPWLAYHVQFLEAEHDPALRLVNSMAGAVPGPLPPVAHPVMRVDPEIGRRGLFVDEDTTTHLLGVPEPEATTLLRRLCAAATDPAVTYRHAWRPHDLVLWDNQAVLHRAEPRAEGHAWRMHRSMVAGSRPYGPAAVVQPWVMAG
jgi:taurine dioxygenase